MLRHLTPDEAELRREYVAAHPGEPELMPSSLALPYLADWVAAGKPRGE
jgi:hypothetical protein